MSDEVIVTLYPRDNKPSVCWKHEDGPLMTLTDGTLHWITLMERFLLWLGVATLKEINEIHLVEYSIPYNGDGIEVTYMDRAEAEEMKARNLYY